MKYIAQVKEYRDKINGNTYFSANVEDVEKDVNYIFPYQYGYGTQSESTINESLGIKRSFGDQPIIKFIKISNCKKRDVVNFGQGDKENFISRLGYYYQD